MGCLVFGCGFLMYHVLEFILFLETVERRAQEGPCYSPAFGIGSLSAILFGILQAYVIFVFPRINVNCHQVFNR
jgi:hypothetical protein